MADRIHIALVLLHSVCLFVCGFSCAMVTMHGRR